VKSFINTGWETRSAEGHDLLYEKVQQKAACKTGKVSCKEAALQPAGKSIRLSKVGPRGKT
jgi:hypothetical protein